MTNRGLLSILSIALSCGFFGAHTAIASDMTLELITSKGLSNSCINCIFQDPYSRKIWVGTWDGLNIYDGNSFKTLKYDAYNENSICNNIIREISLESKGIIWISTDYGFSRIDSNTGIIKRFYPGYEDTVPTAGGFFHLTVLDSGTVYCASEGWGLSYYNASDGALYGLNISHCNTSDMHGIYNFGGNRLVSMDSDGSIHLFLCGDEPTTPIKYEGVILDGVAGVFPNGNSIFFACHDGSIFRHRLSEKGLQRMFIIPDKTKDIASIAEMSDGNILVAQSDGNVWSYSCNGAFSLVKGLCNINIFSLYSGDQDILWVGSDGEGLLKFYSSEMTFSKVLNSKMIQYKNAPVRAFLQDADGSMFVGTKGCGVVELSNSYDVRRVIDKASGLTNNNVFALSQGLFGKEIVIGGDGVGVDILLPETGKVCHINPPDKHMRNVYAIYKDEPNNCLWLGTNGYGLVRMSYSLNGEKVKLTSQDVYTTESGDKPIGSNAIFSIAPTEDGKLWLATRGGGLCLFNPENGESLQYSSKPEDRHSIIHNDLLSLCVDGSGNLWIGTSFGLSCLRKADMAFGKFTNYSEADGIANNTIHGILCDEGELWISTNNGLVHFDVGNGKFTNYSDYPDLQGNEFSDGAYYLAPDGKMYFGGVNGFNYFRPEDISARPFAPTVCLDALYVNQEKMVVFDSEKQIELNHSDNSLNMRFHAMDYIRPENCEYQFKLDGFDSKWIYTGTEHSAVYTNIPPGKYEFLVRCSNGDKVWNGETCLLKIKINAPWWCSIWAILAYTLILCGIIFSAYLYSVRRLKEKEAIKNEQFEQQQQAERYEAKLKFFVNLSHEFCTPLTLISGSSEYIIDNESLPSSTLRHMKVIKNSAARMQRLIGELLEFRKADTGHYAPSFSRTNISDTIRSVADDFSEVLDINRIVFSMKMPEDDLTIITDAGAIEKIMYNLMSNALKYTPPDGYVKIELEHKDNETIIKVTNSGTGIKEEDIDNVFNRFEVLKSFEKELKNGKIMRSGVGLSYAKILAETLSGSIGVESTVNDHTCFTVILPEIKESDISLTDASLDGSMVAPLQIETADYENLESVEYGTGNQTILIVDDEKQLRDLLRDIFVTSGFNVAEAADGSRALEVLSHIRPDIIISDMVMPVMDGKGLLKAVRDNAITKHIPFVFLTFKNEVEDLIESSENGADAFISKPFHSKYLLAVIRHLLDSRTDLKQYYNSSLSNSDVFRGNIIDSNDKEFLVKLTGLIEDNLSDENLSIDFLSEKMFVSRVQLYRKIKELTAMTPSEFINSIKMRYASHQIRTTNRRIQEIMFDSGFNNKSYFYKVFEKTYGESPKSMRLRMSKENKQ